MSTWQDRHQAAVELPTAEERPLLVALWLTELFAEQYRNDYVMREAVAHYVTGTAILLAGQFGDRIDRGTIDRKLSAIAERIGYSRELGKFDDE